MIDKIILLIKIFKNVRSIYPGMMKLVDISDLKSEGLKAMKVQILLPGIDSMGRYLAVCGIDYNVKN